MRFIHCLVLIRAYVGSSQGYFVSRMVTLIQKISTLLSIVVDGVTR